MTCILLTVGCLQVNKQLDHMVAFILKEAQEKASETLVKAKETFAREKAQRVRDERQRILKHFEKMQKEIEVKEKIERSNAINQARLRLLKEREEVRKICFLF
jgi:V-type H+-transporting ATPase subunit E